MYKLFDNEMQFIFQSEIASSKKHGVKFSTM